MSNKSSKSTQCSQYFAAFAAAIGAMAQSATVSWASPTGPQKLNHLTLTDQQIPYVSSTLAFAAGSMCILTGFLANFISRKTAMLLLVIPFTFGWTLIIFASSFTMVIMGRFSLGIATGGVCVLVPIYIAEIAETKNRGILGYLFQLLSTAGTLLVNLPISTSHLNLVCAAMPLIYGSLLLFCPESPTYLMQKNRPGDASRALLWLRGRKYDPSTELNGIQATLNKQPFQQRTQKQEQQRTQKQEQQRTQKKEQQRTQKKEQQRTQTQEQQRTQRQEQQQTRTQRIWYRVSRLPSWYRDNQVQHQYKNVLKSLLRPSSVKALFISYGLFICQQMCGINVLKFYVSSIFGADNEMHLVSTLLITLLSFVATFFSMLIADRLGRRFLLLASQLVIAICCLSLGYYFYITTPNSTDNLIPLAILGIFTIAFSIGLGPIPWVILGEIFPADIKCLAGSITTSASLTLAFIATKTHSSLDEKLGACGVFWMYTSFSLLGIVFVYFIVPETKGICLHSIQQIINEVKPVDSDVLLENSDNFAMKELRDGYKGKFFTL